MDFYKTLEVIPIGDYIFNLILIFLAPVFYVLRIFFGLESLLHTNIQNKKYIKVEILCSLKWADLCTKDKVTYLFHRSVRADSAKLVIFFLDRGASVDEKESSGKTALHIASEKGFCEIASILIDRGGSVKIPEFKVTESAYGSMITPLHNAAWKGNLCTMKKLIQAGAEISARSASGFTPLHSAASAGKTFSAFRQGLCLQGRYSGRMERSISKIGISGDLQ